MRRKAHLISEAFSRFRISSHLFLYVQVTEETNYIANADDRK